MSNPTPTDPNPQAALTIIPTLLRDGNGEGLQGIGNYAYIANKNSNQVVKGAPGFLYSVTVNSTSAGTVTLYDNATTSSGTLGVITVQSSAPPVTVFYQCVLNNGLTVTPSVNALDVTITYR